MVPPGKPTTSPASPPTGGALDEAPRSPLRVDAVGLLRPLGWKPAPLVLTIYVRVHTIIISLKKIKKKYKPDEVPSSLHLQNKMTTG